MRDEEAARHAARMRKRKAVQDEEVAAKTRTKGLLLVHTGPGKGKTTAAMGLALRMLGRGRSVAIVQFIKGAWSTGERMAFARFDDLLTWHSMGEGFTWETQDRARDVAKAREAWDEVKRMIADPSYRMVVADELNIVLRYDYLRLDDVLEVLAARDPMKHVIVTGRNAPQPLIEAADLVTEMEAVKHPFRSGVKAQAGIEF